MGAFPLGYAFGGDQDPALVDGSFMVPPHPEEPKIYRYVVGFYALELRFRHEMHLYIRRPICQRQINAAD